MLTDILSSISFVPPFFIGKVLHTSLHKSGAKVDISKDLDKYGAIELTPGRYYYQDLFADTLEILQTHAKALGKKLKFKTAYLPKIVPKEILQSFGIIDAWPAYVLNISPMINFDDGLYTAIKENNSFCLDPVQCASFYELLKKNNQYVELPLKILDISGYTYRNEFQKKLNSTIKSIEFLRAEFVFAGRGIVGSTRNDLLNAYLNIFDQLNLQWRLVVGSGCYEFPSKEELKAYEKAYNIDTIPVVDMELYSPSLNEWIEVIGASNLFDEKIKRFKLDNNGKSFESGCFGVGLSRLTALLIEALGNSVTAILEETLDAN